MSTPWYVPPQQWVDDRHRFLHEALAPHLPLVVAQCASGIALVGPQVSAQLHRTGEILGGIGMAAVGKFSEIEMLRIAGIRQADISAYLYSRTDVHAQSLASWYSRHLGAAFADPTTKPYEVQMALAELGTTSQTDAIFTIDADGTVSESVGPVILGADPARTTQMQSDLAGQQSLDEVVHTVTTRLGVPVDQMEVALLERGRDPRAFHRVDPGTDLRQP